MKWFVYSRERNNVIYLFIFKEEEEKNLYIESENKVLKSFSSLLVNT